MLRKLQTFEAICISIVCIYLLTLSMVLVFPETVVKSNCTDSDCDEIKTENSDRFKAAVTANGLMLAFLSAVLLAKLFSYLGNVFVQLSFQNINHHIEFDLPFESTLSAQISKPLRRSIKPAQDVPGESTQLLI